MNALLEQHVLAVAFDPLTLIEMKIAQCILSHDDPLLLSWLHLGSVPR
jgi:hypothetical protein